MAKNVSLQFHAQLSCEMMIDFRISRQGAWGRHVPSVSAVAGAYATEFGEDASEFTKVQVRPSTATSQAVCGALCAVSLLWLQDKLKPPTVAVFAPLPAPTPLRCCNCPGTDGVIRHGFWAAATDSCGQDWARWARPVRFPPTALLPLQHGQGSAVDTFVRHSLFCPQRPEGHRFGLRGPGALLIQIIRIAATAPPPRV